MADQLALFPRRGGARPGAGRPKSSTRMPHTPRPKVSPHRPHHVTVRMTRGTWNLRSQRCFAPLRGAFSALKDRVGIRVVAFSVQHDHLHMIVEAGSRAALANAMRSLLIRAARRINSVMGLRRGRRIDDRYHEHILSTPTQVRNACNYVLRNRAIHRLRRGQTLEEPVDPFSSLANEALVAKPSCWLLTKGYVPL